MDYGSTYVVMHLNNDHYITYNFDIIDVNGSISEQTYLDLEGWEPVDVIESQMSMMLVHESELDIHGHMLNYVCEN